MPDAPLRVGVVGCGNISGVYIDNAPKLGAYEVVAVADTDPARATAAAERAGGARALDPDALISDTSIDVVLNLTPPLAHAEVTAAALETGKHVYTEKPLAADAETARRLVRLAADRGLVLACAPDTILGAGYQTALRLLREGAIGDPVAGAGFMMGCGPDAWHPDPEMFFRRGAGPLFDMGPYYLSALIMLLGPIESVTADATTARTQRAIGSGPRAGQTFPVETPTHVSASYRFASGPVVTLVFSFDVQAHTLPNLQLYGTDGTLALPDPNTFGGPVRLRRRNDDDWADQPLDAGHADNARGLGLVEMARHLRNGTPMVTAAANALHVLDAMTATLGAAEHGQRMVIEPPKSV